MSAAFEDVKFQMLLITQGRAVASVRLQGGQQEHHPGLRGSQADGELKIGRQRGKWKLASMEP